MKPPRDADRLFAAPIIDYLGAFSGLNRNGALEYLRDPAERLGLLERLRTAEPPKGDEAHVHDLLRKAVSELDAYDLIERLRRRRG